MVLDSHMHVGDFPYFGVSIDRDGLVATMREHGVATGMVFHPDHQLVRDIIGRTPGLYGLVWVNPRMPDAVTTLVDLLDEPGSRFRGVKLHPLLDGYHPDDPMVHPVMEVLRERRLPVLIHCGHPIFSLPWSIEELIRRFPDVSVILGHMGHGNIVYINASIDVAARNPRVYLETSGMPMHSKIREAVERVGPDRVLFGSDAPFHHLSVELAKVRVSGLPDPVTDAVLGENGQRLFFGAMTPDVVG
ncbi:MAG: amidohydrolase [Chloroflexi bacterium]|nr:amidohydrolase [Chloroflexota bacterium]